MFESRASEIVPVQIPPTAPVLFVHQTILEVQVNRFHCLQELESDMVEPGPIVWRQRIDIVKPNPPNPAKLGIFAELFCHIAQSARCCILRRELGHPRTAVHLHGQIPERCNYRERTNQLCTSIDRFPAHRGLNVLSVRPRSTGLLPRTRETQQASDKPPGAAL